MISQEHAPDEVHMGLYAKALAQNGRRMAAEVQALAQALDIACTGPSIALVSFVRAGLPLGVLLRRALVGLGRDAHHYGVSIVRDRGIDHVALEMVIQRHGAQNIVFVDGWTGKGRSRANCVVPWPATYASRASLAWLCWPTLAARPGWPPRRRTGSSRPASWAPRSRAWCLVRSGPPIVVCTVAWSTTT
jgi:hypothetical protein